MSKAKISFDNKLSWVELVPIWVQLALNFYNLLFSSKSYNMTTTRYKKKSNIFKTLKKKKK